MSLSKKMCLRSVSQKRQSFSHRICDDLCEVLLQFLPIKDKLRLESVSKQFKKTVLQKQNEIILEVKLEGFSYPRRSDSSYEPNLLRLKYSPEYNVVVGMDRHLEVTAFESCYHKPIESLLKKCPNIQSIDLTGFHSENNRILILMLQMITKYCNHLIEFNVLWLNSNDCIESQEFCRKFGQKLKYFRYAKHISDYNLFPNIESIEEFRVLYAVAVEEWLNLNSLNHLKELEIYIDVNKEHLLPKVMKKFEKLTHLTLRLRNNSLSKAFKDFPFHQNLKDLFISFGFNQDFEGMCDSLKQIAIKCPKLKKIVLNSIIVLKNISEVEQIFRLLKAFPSLKRLEISLVDETGLQSTDQWFSFELFKKMPKITHLCLHLYCKSLNESVLKNIDIYLPKLQFLDIKSRFTTDSRGLTQMADILSRLSKLQTIKLRFKHEVDYQPMKAMIIEKCLKIKTIELSL